MALPHLLPPFWRSTPPKTASKVVDGLLEPPGLQSRSQAQRCQAHARHGGQLEFNADLGLQA